MFAAWATGLRPLCPTTARIRMLCVRKFCCHLARSRSGIFIPDLRSFPKELPHQAPYLLSESEVARLLAATATLRSTRSNPLHPQTIRLAFLLTFCCGLRLGEILKLRLADIDTEQMVLRINETKFHKSRLVPVSPSVAADCGSISRCVAARKCRWNLARPWSGTDGLAGMAKRLPTGWGTPASTPRTNTSRLIWRPNARPSPKRNR